MSNIQVVAERTFWIVVTACFGFTTMLSGYAIARIDNERTERITSEKEIVSEIVKLRILTEKIAYKLEIPTEVKVSQEAQSSL